MYSGSSSGAVEQLLSRLIEDRSWIAEITRFLSQPAHRPAIRADSHQRLREIKSRDDFTGFEVSRHTRKRCLVELQLCKSRNIPGLAQTEHSMIPVGSDKVVSIPFVDHYSSGCDVDPA